MNIRKNQAGFAVVEVVLLVVVVGILGFVGLNAYNANQTAKKAPVPASQPKTADKVPTAPNISSASDLATAE
ncbi:MAG TPA: hypothetical protein VMR98_00680, partial [Candidatus Polarisedimenticolaceae bacterium]|nr:hypothetical protein [Candidatus Polarisedimenticolaceae bacterium]